MARGAHFELSCISLLKADLQRLLRPLMKQAGSVFGHKLLRPCEAKSGRAHFLKVGPHIRRYMPCPGLKHLKKAWQARCYALHYPAEMCPDSKRTEQDWNVKMDCTNGGSE